MKFDTRIRNGDICIETKRPFNGRVREGSVQNVQRALLTHANGNDDIVVDDKDCIRCPATSLLNWREYRARLIKGETPLMMRRASTKSGLWAHEIPQLEVGCLLIETGHHRPPAHPEAEEEAGLDRRVIFLAQHDPAGGSRGLILNKPTPFTLGDFTHRLGPLRDLPIHYGGEGRNVVRGLRAHRELHVLHSCGDAPGAARVVDGVYVGARLADAAALVARRLARPGQGQWVAAACSKELVLNGASHWDKPLWRLVLEVMGGRHGLISRELCDEL